MHKSVLLEEVIEGLHPKEGETIVDCTINGGGHTAAILEQAPKISVIGLDADSDAIARARERFGERVTLVNENFANLDRALKSVNVSEVDGFLFDLGWSSNQLTSGKGMSFLKDEPLNMSFGKARGDVAVTARDIVNDWAEESIHAILQGFGEERYAWKIAQKIVEARRSKPIETTGQLVEIITSATPARYHHGKIHPATRTFQALRIAVNDELVALEEGLRKAFEHLKEGGRIAVISFHSIEDRIVKRQFKEWVANEQGAVTSKKPMSAGDAELSENPRARSAKLRVFIKNRRE